MVLSYCDVWYDDMVTGYTGPMVTRHIGGLSQLPVDEMSWGKNSKKKPIILNNFLFSGQFHQTRRSHGHHGHHMIPDTQAAYELRLVWVWFDEKC